MKKGNLAVLSCYILWGLLPVYWKLLSSVDSIYVLASRILWSFVFCALIVAYKREGNLISKTIKNKDELLKLILAGIMVSLNWGLYIVAIHTNHILEASLAYYMNPIMGVVLGFLFFKERLSKRQWLAVIIASFGVIYNIIKYGKVPTFSLLIGGSFAIYGALKKKIDLPSEISLFIETLSVLPIALIYIVYIKSSGAFASYNLTSLSKILLPISGIITSVPLLLFAYGIKTTSMTTSGLLMYVNPTLQLLIGTLIYKEEFTKVNLITFIFIIFALIIYIPTVIKIDEKKVN
ncbi:MAG: EamA family transporter RarD, partial [Tissierellia bacterium]|nr:EamA family transporter RarD [Tissierellia bacterium]